MNAGINTTSYPVKDLAKTRTVYGALPRVEPSMDEPHYVNFNVAGQEVGLDLHGHGQGMTGPVSYWQVADINGAPRGLLDAGAETRQAVTDVGGGKLVATLVDADGNVIGLMQPA